MLGSAGRSSATSTAPVEDLRFAVTQAETAGSPGFVAEAQFHLAKALATRDPGQRRRSPQPRPHVRAIGMAAYFQPLADLLARLEGASRRRPERRETRSPDSSPRA